MDLPMFQRKLHHLLCALVLAVRMASAVAGTGELPGGTRNVILLIGDGMDEQQITIARNYLQGASGQLLMDQLPLRANVQVLAVENRVNGRPVYVADSANTATSMATGVVTSRGRIATAAGSDRDLTTIVELAKAAGYRTGIVTTASVTDATPAAFATHISYRLCENPARMTDIPYGDPNLGGCAADRKINGGSGSIAEQLASSGLDLLLGGGSKHFAPLAEGENNSVLEMARRQGFKLVTSRQELAGAAPDGRLLGLFSAGNMPVRLRGEGGRAAEQPEPSLLNELHPYPGDVTRPLPMTCEPNPGAGAVPTLQEMTETALSRLSRASERGFFLMIESASIDKKAHERRPCGSIGELEQLDEALASALAFADNHPRTLILVTADHAHAAQLIPEESLYARFHVPIYSPGKLARIKTPEGSIMSINYATNNFRYEEHSGASVPLLSNGEGLGRIPAYLVQPAVFSIMRDYLGLATD
jgi:alkaline phosphatase